ncbi:hypothetical protein CLOM_g3571 [Closterium sp. NIES-68]|nr:hypothetical protein CLOM_g3571 [Closterium sp. NIES-68]
MKGGDYDKDSSEDRYPGQFFFVSTQAAAAAGGVDGFEEPATVGKSLDSCGRRQMGALCGVDWKEAEGGYASVELHYVKTTAQPADMMTKRLVEQQHWKCCKLAGMALN